MRNTSIPRPYPFEYYVFWSRASEPLGDERANGVYLTGEANSKYLNPFFFPLYPEAGIDIDTSDDEIVSGSKLDALAGAIASAQEDVMGKPARWPVRIGFRPDPSRKLLPENAVFVHWGGGY